MIRSARKADLRAKIGHCVEIRRGDVILTRGNLIGPISPDLARNGKRRLWGATCGDGGRLCVAAFDPLDAELAVELAA